MRHDVQVFIVHSTTDKLSEYCIRNEKLTNLSTETKTVEQWV